MTSNNNLKEDLAKIGYSLVNFMKKYKLTESQRKNLMESKKLIWNVYNGDV